MSIICGICLENESKYKCPKCRIRYCSLTCYKNSEKHIHDDHLHNRENINTSINLVEESTPLKTAKFDEFYQKSDKLRGLLRHNTVKFHLNKVYRILTSDSTNIGNSDPHMTLSVKEQLAIDYLNTLRYGGIHYNEAIEEFCQLCLESLQSK